MKMNLIYFLILSKERISAEKVKFVLKGSGSLVCYKKSGLQPFLINEALKIAANKGIKYFNWQLYENKIR